MSSDDRAYHYHIISTVLTATSHRPTLLFPLAYYRNLEKTDKTQIRPPPQYKIETPEWIEITSGTVEFAESVSKPNLVPMRQVEVSGGIDRF